MYGRYGSYPDANGRIMRTQQATLQPTTTWQPSQYGAGVKFGPTQLSSPISWQPPQQLSPGARGPSLGNDGTTWKPYSPPPEGDMVLRGPTSLPGLGGNYTTGLAHVDEATRQRQIAINDEHDRTYQQGRYSPYSVGYVNPNGSGTISQQQGNAATGPYSPSQTYQSSMPNPSPMYSDKQTSTALAGIRAKGAQAFTDSMIPQSRSGMGFNSPQTRWNQAMGGMNAAGQTMQAAGQQYLNDQQANAANQLAWRQARFDDVMGQANAQANIGQLLNQYQQQLANSLLAGFQGATSNAARPYMDAITDNSFWGRLGLQQQQQQQGNINNGLDWMGFLMGGAGGGGSSYNPLQQLMSQLYG